MSKPYTHQDKRRVLTVAGFEEAYAAAIDCLISFDEIHTSWDMLAQLQALMGGRCAIYQDAAPLMYRDKVIRAYDRFEGAAFRFHSNRSKRHLAYTLKPREEQ